MTCLVTDIWYSVVCNVVAVSALWSLVYAIIVYVILVASDQSRVTTVDDNYHHQRGPLELPEIIIIILLIFQLSNAK